MSQRRRKKDIHIGSSVDAFLKEEGIFEKVETRAIREVLAWRRAKAKKEKHPSPARPMRTTGG